MSAPLGFGPLSKKALGHGVARVPPIDTQLLDRAARLLAVGYEIRSTAHGVVMTAGPMRVAGSTLRAALASEEAIRLGDWRAVP